MRSIPRAPGPQTLYSWTPHTLFFHTVFLREATCGCHELGYCKRRVYIYIYVCIYLFFICIHIGIHIHIHIHMHMHIHVHIHIHLHIHLHIHISLHTYIQAM